MHKYRSNGKILITGEYAVHDGGLALALPSKFGQSLSIAQGELGQINWIAYQSTGEVWFKVQLDITNPCIINPLPLNDSHDQGFEKAKTLSKILVEAQKLNPLFINPKDGYSVETRLDFPTNWGLGSSSTLITNIASWAGVDPYVLLWNGFSGSGYDIACAQNDKPLTYQLQANQPIIDLIEFNPTFKDCLFFVHLNQKQNSREGIKRYKTLKDKESRLIKQISQLTVEFIQASSLQQFENLIQVHERYIASAIQLTLVKEKLFSDYKGSIKSLGAWGGEFILVTGSKGYVQNYFQVKGYPTIIPYPDMVY